MEVSTRKKFEICNGERPRVLLLGNGLNRAYKNESWTDLINSIKEDNETNADDYLMPMSLKATLLSKGKLREKLRDYCNDKSSYSCQYPELLSLIGKITSLPFDYILTTNYSYEIEMAMTAKNQLTQYDILDMMRFTEGKRAENKYFLHTYNEVNNGEKQIWHIHGEFRKPSSVILGHYDYGNLLARYQQISFNHVEKFIKNKKEGDENDQVITSWLDAFILGDVYIVGLGMDFAETDLWWLLEKKKWVEKKLSGKTVYYWAKKDKENSSNCKETTNKKDIKDEEECKRLLLELYGVKIKDLDTIIKNDDFLPFYNKVVDDLKNTIS